MIRAPITGRKPTVSRGAGFLFTMKTKTYSEKLKDPRWQKLRLQVFERDDFTCNICKSKEQTLNVHHKKYAKSGNPWDIETGSLMTLCEGCHKLMEDAKKKWMLLFYSTSAYEIGEIKLFDDEIIDINVLLSFILSKKSILQSIALIYRENEETGKSKNGVC